MAAERLGAVLDRPAGAARSPGRRAGKARRWPVPAFLGRVRPVKALTTVAFSAALVAIVANAVLFQKGRQVGTPAEAPRSAPAASQPTPARTVAGDAGAPAAAAPPSQPAAASPGPSAVSPGSGTRAASATRHGATKAAGGDAIGALLGGASAAADTSAAKADDAKPETKADPLLRRAQRQLATLGYAVRPDGRMDDGTRQAIKRFAHDHHLKGGTALTPELRRSIADAAAAPAKPAPEAASKTQ